MADENYKLAKFQAAVFAEVDMKTAQIKQKAELLKEQELEKNKDNQLDKSYNYIQRKSNEIKKKYKREVAKFSLDKKRELLKKRTEISNRIFDNVTTMLVEYTKTSEYKEFLLNSMKQFASSINLSAIAIFVNEADIKYKADIEKLFSIPVTITASNDVKIGGFVACNDEQGLYFDETLEQYLLEQKDYFMENSHLAI